MEFGLKLMIGELTCSIQCCYDKVDSDPESDRDMLIHLNSNCNLTCNLGISIIKDTSNELY